MAMATVTVIMRTMAAIMGTEVTGIGAVDVGSR
jgi:hypothetical protein